MAARETEKLQRPLDLKEARFLGEIIMRAKHALLERRLTPATEKAVEAADWLVEQDRLAEAADAWNEIYYNGTAFEGHDFHGPGRILGCDALKYGGYRAACLIPPPPGVRKGDVVNLWLNVTIRVEKVEKVFNKGLPHLIVWGRKHDCSEDRLLTAPWLEPPPLWQRIKNRLSIF